MNSKQATSFLVGLVFATFSALVHADVLPQATIVPDPQLQNLVSVKEVKLIDSRLVPRDESHTDAELRMHLLTSASACESVSFVGSAYFDSAHANSHKDDSIVALASEKTGCTAGAVQPTAVSLSLWFWVGPFAPKVRYLSFRGEYVCGVQFWRLYQIDFSDPNRIQFNYIKTYSISGGQVVDGPGNCVSGS